MSRKTITVTYGGHATTFRQQNFPSRAWSWVTIDTRTKERIDGAEADPTGMLYMLWQHMQDGDAQFTSGLIED